MERTGYLQALPCDLFMELQKYFSIAHQLIMEWDGKTYDSTEYGHNCSREHGGCFKECKLIFLTITFAWNCDRFELNLYFSLSIEQLYALSQQMIYTDSDSYICIEDTDYYNRHASIVISQSGTKTYIKFFQNHLKIADKDAIASKHILKRLKEIYNEYLSSE